MITAVGEKTYEIRGLSTDKKPIPQKKEWGNGTIFLEMDTGKVFCYDADHETWIEL